MKTSLKRASPRVDPQAQPPNKSLQRSGRHKVLGRGRPGILLHSTLRARELTSQPAAAELSRYASVAVVIPW